MKRRDDQKVFSCEQTAIALGLSYQYVQHLARAKKIRRRRDGKFNLSALVFFMADRMLHPVKHGAPPRKKAAR